MKRLLSIISLMSISIVGSAQVDVHCHMIPDSYLEAVKAHGMEMDEGFPIPEPTHILYGSDYPYVAAPALLGAKKALEGRLGKHGLGPEVIFSDNAKHLFQ